MRRVKLGGTLGPACDAPEVLRGLLDAGLELARINFSHGSRGEARVRAGRLRRIARAAGRTVTLIGDLQGPRLRVGVFPGGGIEIEAGTQVELALGVERAHAGALPVPWAPPGGAFRRGLAVCVDDGNVVLRVEGRRGDRVRCRVERGGRVADRKGINAPGLELASRPFTAKDRRDLALAAELRCDALALSFVRGAPDVRLARRRLEDAGRAIPVIAKIEAARGFEHLEEIVDAADGVLVARGDLGVEFPLERLPGLQREILAAARRAGKPGLVAGHLLASMSAADRPTRAEVADVALAVRDGADGLVLTGETASGAHPVEAARTLSRIAAEAGIGSGRRDWWS